MVSRVRWFSACVASLGALTFAIPAEAHVVPVWKGRAVTNQAVSDTYEDTKGVVDYDVRRCWRMTIHEVRCDFVLFIVYPGSGSQGRCFGTGKVFYRSHSDTTPKVARVKFHCARK